MACALARDDPMEDCRPAGIERTVVTLAVSGVLLGALGAGILCFRARRRRRRAGVIPVG
jgi:hypothetical protein